MIAAYLLSQSSVRLKDLAFTRLGIEMTEITALIGTGRNQLTMDQVDSALAGDYACGDVEATFGLAELLRPEVDERGLDRLLREIELPLVPVLVEHGARPGSPIDVRLPEGAVGRDHRPPRPARAGDPRNWPATRVQHQLDPPAGDAALRGVEAALRPPHQDRLLGRRRRAGGAARAAPDRRPDPGVPHARQAQVDLRRRPAGGGQPADRPRPHLVQPDRRRDRPPLLDQPEPAKHPDPDRAGAARPPRLRRRPPTGAPAVRASRSCSRPTTRRSSCACWPHMCGEPFLVEAFRGGEDIHRATAAIVYGVEPAAVTSDMRRIAKTVNFGVLYGMQPFGLSRDIGTQPGRRPEVHRRLLGAVAEGQALLRRDAAVRRGATATSRRRAAAAATSPT